MFDKSDLRITAKLWSPPPGAIVPRQAGGRQWPPVGKLSRAIVTLRVKKVKQADRTTLVRVLSNVAVFLRDVEISQLVELNDLVAHAQSLIGIAHVGKSLAVGGLLLLLCLRDGGTAASNLALVAIENRQRNASVEAGSVDPVD